jgi:hypothetical protein
VLEQMCHSFGSAKWSKGVGTTPQGSNKRYFAILIFFFDHSIDDILDSAQSSLPLVPSLAHFTCHNW